MRIYRNHYYTEQDGSKGFGFFLTMAESVLNFRQALSNEKTDPPDDHCAEVARPIEIDPTKEGIVWALNRHASHADNR